MTYVPYLRGRQFELIALRELVKRFGTASIPVTPLPIIEPVRLNLSQVESVLKAYCAASAPIILIVNPAVGHIAPLSDLCDLANKYACVIPAFIVGNVNNVALASDFVTKTTSNDVALIHDNDSPQSSTDSIAIRAAKNVIYEAVTGNLSTSYSAAITGSKILIEEKFPVSPNNSSYPNDSFFTDTHLHNTDYAHFGDYTINRREYREGGGPPNAVALHLLYDNTTELRYNHSVSSPTLSKSTVDVMYADAMRGVVAFAATPKAYASQGLSLLLATASSFPGLGKPKQFSIMHHIELRSR